MEGVLGKPVWYYVPFMWNWKNIIHEWLNDVIFTSRKLGILDYTEVASEVGKMVERLVLFLNSVIWVYCSQVSVFCF